MNKLNASQTENLKMMFIEAKWMYNHVLNISNNSDIDIFSLKYTDLNEITHFDKDKNEIKTILTVSINISNHYMTYHTIDRFIPERSYTITFNP